MWKKSGALVLLPMLLVGCGSVAALLLGVATNLAVDEAINLNKIRLRVIPSTAEPGAKVRLTVDGYSLIGNKVSLQGKRRRYTVRGDDIELLAGETQEFQDFLDNGSFSTRNNDGIDLRVRDSIDRPGNVIFGVDMEGEDAGDEKPLSIVLNAGGLPSLYVQPPSVSLARNTQQQFRVFARDAQGIAFPVDEVTWEATGNIGVDASGRVTVPPDIPVGTYEVTARVTVGGNEASGTAEVDIRGLSLNNRIYEVQVYPPEVRLYTGDSYLTFMAIAIDDTGLSVPGAEFSWSLNPNIASIDPASGVLTTGAVEGELQVTAVLTNAAQRLSGSAPVTIEAQP